MIQPHGGRLINRSLSKKDQKRILARQDKLATLKLDKELVTDVINIADGAYSPLTGFLKQADFQAVLDKMRLASGIVWPIPIVLDITQKQYERLKDKNEVLLKDQTGKPTALLTQPEFYQYDKQEFAQKVYGTTDKKHPGVAAVCEMGPYLVGGEIQKLSNGRGLFSDFNYTPNQTREIFKQRGWETITAFQTRNVPHRGHEFLQMQALARTDGLFIQPVVGEKKLQDFKDEYIVGAYDILVQRYYPTQRVLLGILPLKMRYAGPREAVLHAIIRKNYGCTHFIIGRDHAGAKDYYAPYAAQKIFDEFAPDEIGVQILKFSEVVYYPQYKMHDFVQESIAADKNQNQNKAIHFSGTKIRDLVKKQQEPPSYLMRPEIYQLLTNSYNTMVDQQYKHTNNNKKGFVLWFTGLSQSGKTTIADKVYKLLKEQGIKVERLDGDVVRESLTKDLGFSKEDRDKNITRVGFVASLLSKNGVGVVASFISPYKERRKHLRKTVSNFIEVYVSTPLEVCEKRDKKGLYKQARAGKIKNFTGISDPYEEPQNPEILLSPHKDPLEMSVQKVMDYLQENKFI
jgi:sulfate adenylyltransferase